MKKRNRSSQRRPSAARNTAHSASGGHLNGQKGGQIRLIGGDWRGRKLPVLSADGLRPTSDRVRETLFNWLQFDIPGARVLDVFSGTGALGLEALSRGAKQVTLLEAAPKAARQLQANLQRLAPAADRATLVETDALNWLVRTPVSDQTVYDGVFLDPPFGQGLMQPAVDALLNGHWVHDRSWLYLEQEKDAEWPELPQGWSVVKEKTTAQVRFGLAKKES
ncbi:MAG: 16S rRNA (guanine(966)-N(2))-methyltransferase RsmD [Hydrogenovibrio sp.]|uniref:16S rRNA (guanine(966)-N(2))-methyltransferase RsmD n=1 Tax=Hydrogenovibrio sp. TaxID=2065821 RepID=UPI002870AEAF|nr:16S rRNA (guanine(966)-N(2))-methyltransferase RsmD [Hydrogenovibrio sp.]MDR9499405.1 16S rRNA (guanine(966)-N(2))-methyltransferase RsmD [Hydrogenovibrio sp.]